MHRLVGESERLVSESERLVGESERLVGESERLVGVSERLVSESERLVSESERLVGESERLVSESEGLVDESERLFTCSKIVSMGSFCLAQILHEYQDYISLPNITLSVYLCHMDKEKAEEEKQFIRRIFIDEIGRLQKEGFYFFSFIMMGQAIEALGCFLDNKPLKARAQSSKRFSKALNILMGNDYRAVNKDFWLYDRLRNQLTHSFVPSKSLLLCSRENQPEGAEHLDFLEERLVLVAEDMYDDLVKGCEKLFGMIDRGKVPLKQIAASPEELGLK